ncbi:MAG: glycosyltransferase family 9 protein [Fimbriimonadales bacterium]
MEWFNDQPLRPRPHIAVLFYDAIGDFVIITPLLRGLKEKYPDCTLDYFSGERTRELEEALPYIDARFSVFGNPNALQELPEFIKQRRATAGEYDLVINCDFHPTMAFVAHMLQPRYVVGRCFGPDLREEVPKPPDKLHRLHEEFWSAPDLLQRYGDILKSTYIGEIWCRLAFVETDFYRTEVPTQPPECDVPEVLISTGGRRSAKLWIRDYWKQVIDWCFARGYRVGLLGDQPQRQSAVYHTGDTESWLLERTPLIDLRGRFSLPQVAGALAQARACVSVDNGIMHIAYSVRTPTIALFGASPWMVWTPPLPHLYLVLPDEPCSKCYENRFRNAGCLLERHQCMLSVRPERVIAQLQEILGVGEADVPKSEPIAPL